MKIAVVGSGVSGLGAAWLLRQAGHQVVVYESQPRPGGHANTVDVEDGGRTVAVDTGFIVFNDRTYPNLVAWFDHLGVSSHASTMSFAVSLDDGRLEYAGDNLMTLFTHPGAWLRPSHHRMALDILRFYREARGLADQPCTGETLGAWLATRRYSAAFVDRHLLPMAAAIWSAEAGRILDFPASSLIRFFANHGLLSIKNRPVWRTVTGGSRSYVSAVTKTLPESMRLGCAVASVTRLPNGVRVRDWQGGEDFFDHVVMSAAADRSLAMLSDASALERRVLGSFTYSRNTAVLHRDVAQMPRRRRVWASWNYLGDHLDGGGPVSVTYWMNRLQGLVTDRPLFVTLNPLTEPGAEIANFSYDHPQFDMASATAQEALGDIQGVDRVWFCGAYCGWGFHEDGLASGLAVAEAIGARRPWSVVEMSKAAWLTAPRPALQVAAE